MRTLSRQHLRRRMIRIAAFWTVAELTTTFNNAGTADGNLSDPTNWDNGTPTPTDDMVISATPVSGSASGNNLSAGATLTAGSFTVAGTSNSVTWNGATCSGTLVASSNTFNASPGTIKSTGSCVYGTGVSFGTVTIGASDVFFGGGAGTSFSTMIVPNLSGGFSFSGVSASVLVMTLEPGAAISNFSTMTITGLGADNVTFPSAGNVLAGSGTYGPNNGPTVTPTWQRANNEASDAAMAQWVALGKPFGVNGASNGTLASGGGAPQLIDGGLIAA